MAEGPGRGARLGVALLLVGILAVGIALARDRWVEAEPTAPLAGSGAPGGMSSGSAPAAGSAEGPAEGLPEGFLGVIVGGPREQDPTLLCDEGNWPKLGALIHEVRPGEVRVDEPSWARQGASARAGIASWVSKCQLDGGAVRIFGADSGQLLGTYDPREGLRSAS